MKIDSNADLNTCMKIRDTCQFEVGWVGATLNASLIVPFVYHYLRL